MSDPRDRDLGMDRAITRRDFLNGVSVALSGSSAYPWFGGPFGGLRAGGDVEQADIGVSHVYSPSGYHALMFLDFPITLGTYRGVQKPWVIGRQRFGRIAIANSDAGHEAETQTAIDEAHRAVQELLQP
jgi:hypothetical protein